MILILIIYIIFKNTLQSTFIESFVQNNNTFLLIIIFKYSFRLYNKVYRLITISTHEYKSHDNKNKHNINIILYSFA
jgi:hypothetical protein